MGWTRLGLAACALVFVGLSACTTFPGGARVEGYSGEERLFRGLANAPPEGAAPTKPQVRYIFHIHGMGLTDREPFHEDLHSLLAEKFVVDELKSSWHPAKLAQPVKVHAESMDCSRPWKDHLEKEDELGGEVKNPCYFDSFGTFRVDVFRNNRNAQDATEEVRLYTYFWHRDLWRIQEPHLRADMLRNKDRPPWLNTFLKHDTMDGGLSDAAAYAGPSGALVRAGIESVLCTMARDAAGQGFAPRTAKSLSDCGLDQTGTRDVEFSYVTHSLGSRMLFDVLAPPDKLGEASQPTAARGFLIDRAEVVFMAANQLPLLALGSVILEPVTDLEASSTRPAKPSGGLKGLLEAKRALAASGHRKKPLQVVAFQDPDDILGFRASDVERRQVEFVPVTHRNIGAFLNIIAMPQWAHDQELNNSAFRRTVMGSKTRQMILCGAKIRNDGRVIPYECRP